MAKLVDAPDLGSGVLRRVGSSPITRTMRQKRNFTTKKFLFFVVKSTMRAAKSRRMRGVVTPCGLRLASVVNYNENRQCEQQKVTRSTAECGAAWVAKSECCQLRQTKSTTRAAKGHAKHRRMWCRVGCGWQALSIITRIDNADSGWSNEGRAKLVPFGPRKGGVVNLKDIIDNACSNRSQDAWRSHALRVAVGKCCQLRQTKLTTLAYRNPRGCRGAY